MAGNKKHQPEFWIGFDIAVPVKQFIARDIRQKELLVIEHLDEAWLATLRRRVAIARRAARGHYAERGISDEILDPRMHGRPHFSRSPLGRITKLFLEGVLHGSSVQGITIFCFPKSRAVRPWEFRETHNRTFCTSAAFRSN